MNFLKLRRVLAGLVFTSLIASPALAYRITLDPGHGGTDTGAVRGEARESTLVLKVAQQLKKLLETQSDIQVSLTRSGDVGVSLPERVRRAEKSQADLFVSLHANSAGDSRAKGVEFFFQNALPPDEDSLYLANLENQNIKESAEILDASDEPSKKGDVAAILEDLRRQHRIESSLRLTETLAQVWNAENAHQRAAIKQAPFYVISKTNMPSVLIEIGFLTNPQEVKNMMTAGYQEKVARKIYSALLTYKEKMDKDAPVRQSAR